MESRLMIAFALCAIMALIFIVAAVRYRNNRKQFKIRQSGRGKASGSIPAE